MNKIVESVHRLIIYITFFTVFLMVLNFIVSNSNIVCEKSSVKFINSCKINGGIKQ